MSLDSISRDPFPFEEMKVEPSVVLPVPEHTIEQPHKSFFTMTPQEIANWIDRRSRLVFPLAFIAFNCFYWTFVWF